ncbi:unnamed protein product [Lota lota]
MALSTNITAPQSNDKPRKYFSLLFYQAVRDLKPVWMLEDMRTMETFYQEVDDTQRTFNPSEALLYAIVHDHQAYAQYLLSNYTDEALSRPGERFCCCPSSAPHLAMTVRYDRRHILGLILQEVHRTPSIPSYTDQGGLLHVEDGKTTLHLACELARPEAVTMLLGNGASPCVEDHQGMTPLDVLLVRFREPSNVKPAERRRCLDNLLMFMPAKCHFKMKGVLEKEPDFWSKALGEATFQYLVGKTPAALVLSAMQTVLRQLSPARFPDSLHELPIPSSLKPLSLHTPRS